MSDFKVTQLDENVDFDNLAYWDVVIVGAGPAGLAASLTTAHRGLTTLVIEAKNKPGGQPEFLYPDKMIVDIPGFPDGISGDELSVRTFRQALQALVQFRFNEELIGIEDTEQSEKEDPLKKVVTSQGEYLCRKVILATGLLHHPRRLPVLDQLNSKNVFYKVPRRGDYQDCAVVVIGGGDSALDAALMVQDRGGQVHLLVRKPQSAGKTDSIARLAAAGGDIRTECEVVAAEIVAEQIQVTVTGGAQLRCDLAIVQIGFLSAKETFQRLNVQLNDDGSIAIDPYFETSRPGIFAVGDVHGDIKLIAVAWAEGIQAAIYAFKEITSPYWLNERRLQDQKLLLISNKMTHAARQSRKR